MYLINVIQNRYMTMVAKYKRMHPPSYYNLGNGNWKKVTRKKMKEKV